MSGMEELYQRIMSLLETSDPAPFESLLSHLTLKESTNVNKALKKAMVSIKQQQHLESLLLKLLHIVRFSDSSDSRALAAVLLRKQIPSAWPHMSPSARASVKETLLLCFQKEQSRDVHINICYAISDLMTSLMLNKNEFCNGDGYVAHKDIANGGVDDKKQSRIDYDDANEFISFMMNICSSPDSPMGQKEGGLLILSHLLSKYTSCERELCLGLDFMSISQMHDVLRNILMFSLPVISKLHDSEINLLEAFVYLKLAALRATCNFIQAIAHDSTFVNLESFQGLLTGSVHTLSQLALKLKHQGSSFVDDGAQKALEIFTELVDAQPEFVLKQLEEVVDCAFEIVDSQLHIHYTTRHKAIELLLMVIEKSRKAPSVRKQTTSNPEFLPGLIRRLFSSLLSMLLDVVDDPVWHSSGSCKNDLTAGESSNFQAGQEFLDWFANTLGGDKVLPVAQELLTVYISDMEDWRKRYAALIALAQIAEGCAKAMTKKPEPILHMVHEAFQDHNPKVRWAAINAVVQLTTDLAPLLQEKYHQRFVPCLLEAMDDNLNPRIQAHAAIAISQFSKNCSSDILSLYLEGIVGKLLPLLQSKKSMVQEEALTALAAVAECSKTKFEACYESVMPHLKAILMASNGKSSKKLYLISLYCISFVGLAVGKDKLEMDAKDVINIVLNLLQSQEQVNNDDHEELTKAEEDDNHLTTACILKSLARLLKLVGAKEILPHMNIIMPFVLRSVQLKPDVTITDIDENEITGNGDIADSIQTITIRDKKIEIRTSVLEEKATACSMLCSFALELKEDFCPWIDQVAPFLVQLLKCYLDEEVRKAAVLAMPEFLTSAKLAVEKGVAEGKDESYVRQLSSFLIPAMTDELLKRETESELVLMMLDAINRCVQAAGLLIDNKCINAVVDVMKHVITSHLRRNQKELDDFEEDGSTDKESEFIEEAILNQVKAFFTTLITTFKYGILSTIEESVMPIITTMMSKDCVPYERRVAFCIFNEVAEQCKEQARKYYNTSLPFLLEACTDNDPDVRQAAIYGLGVCAEFGGVAFKNIAKEAFDKLRHILKQPTAYANENAAATDNAVSALGKICLFQKDNVDSSEGLSLWLSCLPIRNDMIEAKAVHEHLCSMVERSGWLLMDLNTDSLPKVVEAFAKIMSAGNELASEETLTRIQDLLWQLKQTLPAAAFSNVWSSLQPEHQNVLRSVNLSP